MLEVNPLHVFWDDICALLKKKVYELSRINDPEAKKPLLREIDELLYQVDNRINEQWTEIMKNKKP